MIKSIALFYCEFFFLPCRGFQKKNKQKTMPKRRRELVPGDENASSVEVKEEQIRVFRRKNWIAPMSREIQSRLEKKGTVVSGAKPLVITSKEVENLMRDDTVTPGLLSLVINGGDWTPLVGTLISLKKSVL